MKVILCNTEMILHFFHIFVGICQSCQIHVSRETDIISVLFHDLSQIFLDFASTFICFIQLVDREQTMSFITEEIIQFIQKIAGIQNIFFFNIILLCFFIIEKGTIIIQTAVKYISQIRCCHGMYMVAVVFITKINA